MKDCYLYAKSSPHITSTFILNNFPNSELYRTTISFLFPSQQNSFPTKYLTKGGIFYREKLVDIFRVSIMHTYMHLYNVLGGVGGE